jgi:hypothetical protein
MSVVPKRETSSTLPHKIQISHKYWFTVNQKALLIQFRKAGLQIIAVFSDYIFLKTTQLQHIHHF